MLPIWFVFIFILIHLIKLTWRSLRFSLRINTHTHHTPGNRWLDKCQPSLISFWMPLWKHRQSETGAGRPRGRGVGGLDKQSGVQREWTEAGIGEEQVYRGAPTKLSPARWPVGLGLLETHLGQLDHFTDWSSPSSRSADLLWHNTPPGTVTHTCNILNGTINKMLHVTVSERRRCEAWVKYCFVFASHKDGNPTQPS